MDDDQYRSLEPGAPARMPVKRRAFLAVAMPAMVMSPGAQAADDPKHPSGQIVVGWSQEPTVFNPLLPRLEVDQGIWFALFNPLWRVEPDGTFVPELASEVPTLENGGISADGLSWNIKLRKGVKWHDGVEFTAEDVKYTIDLLNTPSFRAYTRQGHSLVRNLTIHNPYEISWTMARAYAPYVSLLTWTFMVPKHVLETATDPNTAPFNSAPIGTGPFKWGKRVAGEGVTVTANRDYFGEGPYVERVTFNYIPDLNIGYTQFKTGQIDYIGYYGLPAQYYESAKALKDRSVFVVQNPQVLSLALNFGKSIFGDKAVRQAMYGSLNKRGIADIVYYGLPQTTESITPKESWAFAPDLPTQVYDLAAANKTLDEADWKRGPDGFREKNGERLSFTVATVAGDPQREQTLQIIQQDWQKVGISAQIRMMPAAVVFGDYYTKSQFDCLLLATTYGTGADPDPAQRFSSTAIPVQGGSGLNFYQYKNQELDRLLEMAQTTFDRAERKALYQRVQGVLRDDLAILPICQSAVLEGTKAKLLGYRPNLNVSINSWNIGSWHWQA